MTQKRRLVPSPAIFISVLALVAALAGVAVAGPDAGSSASAKKTAKKALAKAKKANKKAKSAKSDAGAALSSNLASHKSVLSGPALNSQGVVVAETTLTTTTQTRILASASAVIGNDGDDSTICWLNAGGAFNNVDNDISQRVFSSVPAAPPAANAFAEMSVNGSVIKPAGTHTIRLYCAITSGGSDPVIDRIDLLAWTASS